MPVDGSGASQVEKAAQLLQVDARALASTLTQRRMQMSHKSSVYSIPLRVEAACDARDALAASIYSGLFAWVVRQVNVAAADVADEHAPAASAAASPALIGILDVFGFEDLQTNSFEQLCINYTNEKLQAHFTSTVFREAQVTPRSYTETRTGSLPLSRTLSHTLSHPHRDHNLAPQARPPAPWHRRSTARRALR